MATLIDSSVFISAERGKLDFDAVLEKSAEDEVALAAITASELLHGVHRAGTTEQRSRREAFVERILAEFAVLPFDLLAARIHARLWAQLASRGVAVGTHDLMIAATAVAGGHGVATCDERSFRRIPGLAIVMW